jgi:outer membrane protein TolC
MAAGPSGAVPTDGISTKAPSAWDGMLAALAKQAASAAERRLAAESDALAAEVAAIDAKTKPTLTATLGAQYGSDGSGDFTPMRPSSTGQLALTWELPWNGMSRTETYRVGLRRRDLELQIEAEREARRVRERQALQQLEAAKAQHGLLEAQLALAKKQQKLVNDRYLTGKASAIELSTAEAALLGVHLDRTRLSNAVAESLLILAEARGVRDVSVLSRI